MRGTSLTKFTVSTFLVALIVMLLGSAWAALPTWTGKVVGVSDGDTITVMRDGRGVKIRLAEIDCPEKHQSYGQAAKRFTSDFCFGKEVTVKPATIDRYGRVVAHVMTQDSRNLNEELVRAGLAWQYRRYSKSAKLAALEVEAREAKRGLWSEPDPVPPWQWRRTRR
jgi:endonuclease YncB( thermonuclease family)